MNPLLFGVGLLVTGLFMFWEWRRPNRRHLGARLLATLLAVVALGLLSLPVGDPITSRSETSAALWTAGGSALRVAVHPASSVFALPDAITAAPPHTSVIPDMGTLRRRLPALRTLQIIGDGLDPSELPALSGLQVDFYPPDVPPTTPALRFLRWPRELPLGTPFTVTGRVGGLTPGTNLPVSLEAPDGTKTETPTSPADAQGEGTFTLQAAPPATTGRFVWQLRVGRTPESLGVSVVPPVLPRVLVLEGEPHFDTAALRRWYEGAGGTLTVRTRIGKANTQFAAAQGSPAAFGTVDAPLLSGFDLVLADGTALVNLPPEQRATLITAVEKTGLGLLVRADAAVLPPDAPQVPTDLLPLFPWKLTPVGEGTPGEERPVRLQWPGQTVVSEVPVSAAPFAINLAERQTSLVTDREDHPLVATLPRGRGQLAATLVRATTRWQRENEDAAFAAYWSHLFSGLSRSEAAPGRWALLDGEAGPMFVDHPLELRWSGPRDAAPAPGHVTTAADPANVTLPLAQDEREPGTWLGTLWPRHPGWHRVTAASGGTPFNFYVHPADAWPALQASRRREATARFAAGSAAPSRISFSGPALRPHTDPAWWFALFVVAAGYLWTERRFAAASPSPLRKYPAA